MELDDAIVAYLAYLRSTAGALSNDYRHASRWTVDHLTGNMGRDDLVVWLAETVDRSDSEAVRLYDAIPR